MTTDGLVDGSWELTVMVTDQQIDKMLRVKGDLHVGGVMLRLVEALGVFKAKYFNISNILKYVKFSITFHIYTYIQPGSLCVDSSAV